MRSRLTEPSREQILRYCAAEPVERVFLEDVARRSLGRFAATSGSDGGAGCGFVVLAEILDAD